MGKKLVSLFVSIIMLLGLTGISFADTPAKGSENNVLVVVNGNTLTLDVPGVIKNNRTLVPLAAITKALGADVKWDGPTQTVTVTLGNLVVQLVIGSSYATITNINKNVSVVTALDVPAQLVNSRTMVPLKFLSESFGANVSWDGATYTVHIRRDSTTIPTPEAFDKFFNEFETHFGKFFEISVESDSIVQKYVEKSISYSEFKSQHDSLVNRMLGELAAVENIAVPNEPFIKLFYNEYLEFMKLYINTLMKREKGIRPDGVFDYYLLVQFKTEIDDLKVKMDNLNKKYLSIFGG